MLVKGIADASREFETKALSLRQKTLDESVDTFGGSQCDQESML
jgi:hypothetical protein